MIFKKKKLLTSKFSKFRGFCSPSRPISGHFWTFSITFLETPFNLEHVPYLYRWQNVRILGFMKVSKAVAFGPKATASATPMDTPFNPFPTRRTPVFLMIFMCFENFQGLMSSCFIFFQMSVCSSIFVITCVRKVRLLAFWIYFKSFLKIKISKKIKKKSYTKKEKVLIRKS